MSDTPTGGDGGAVSADEALQKLEHISDGETLLGVKSTRKPYLFCYDLLVDHAEMSRRTKGMIFGKIVYAPNFKLEWPWYYPPQGTALPSLARTNNEEDMVWGVIYNTEFADLQPLERNLRVPARYHKRQINVIDRGGRRIPASTYVLTVSGDGIFRPSQEYLEKLIDGAMARGLPDEWLAGLRGLEAEVTLT